jgi:hypothetical protein
LRAAADFDALESQGQDIPETLKTLRGRPGRYDVAVLDALEALVGGTTARTVIREIPLAALREGMTFASDVKLTSGTMLVARGFEVTPSFLQRVKNFRPGTVAEPVRVIIQHGDEPMIK